MSTYASSGAVTDGLRFVLDAENEKSWSYNVYPNPINVSGWVGASVGSNCTITRDLTFNTNTESPAKGTPLRMLVTGSDPRTGGVGANSIYISPAANGQTWTLSAYARSNTTVNNCELYILGLSSSNSFISTPNQIITITPTWQRFSLTTTFANTSIVGIGARLDGPNPGNSSIIWWDGVQLERNSSATDFNPYPNIAGNKISSLSLTPSTFTLVGSTSHNNVSPKSFNTNATATTQQNYITPPSPITFASGNEYSLEFWVKLRSGAPVTSHSLVGQLSTDQWVLVNTNDTTGDSWNIRFRESGGTYRDSNVITSPNIQNSWTQIVLTFDSSFYVNFYVNGTFLNVETTGSSTLLNISAIMGGYNSGGNYFPFQGSMALCRVYNKKLSDGEVRTNFNSVRSRFGV